MRSQLTSIRRWGLSVFWIPAAVISFAHEEKPKEPLLPTPAKSSVDLIQLDGKNPSIPLRFGGIVEGSERIELGGKLLKKGTDYIIDYIQGSVVLFSEHRAGQSIRASYRYDEQHAQGGGLSGAQSSFHFDFMPGAAFRFGFGMAERGIDGSVYSSSVWGMQNALSFGPGGNLKGLFLLGERRKVQARSWFDPSSQKQKSDSGTEKSHAIVQQMAWGGSWGKFELGYQDIGKGFGAFQSFRDSGFDAKQIEQFQKERGLKRFSLEFHDVGAGPLKLGQQLRRVTDERGAIQWQELSLKGGDWLASWSSRRVSSSFSRFVDLAESDREQLAKEKGLQRQQFSLSNLPAQNKGNAFRFALSSLKSEKGAFNSSTVSWENTQGGFQLARLSVDPQFTHLNAMPGSEVESHVRTVGQLYQRGGLTARPDHASAFLRSAGLMREGWRAWITPKKGTLSLEQVRLAGSKDSGKATSLSWESPGLLLRIHERNLGSKLTELSNLIDFEKDRLGSLPGLKLSSYELKSNPNAKRSFEAAQMRSDSPQGGAFRTTFGYRDPSFHLSWGRRRVDARFTPLQMGDPEAGLLQNLRGLDQTDLLLKWRFARNGMIDLNWMSAKNLAQNRGRRDHRSLLSWAPDPKTFFSYFRNEFEMGDQPQPFAPYTMEVWGASRDFGALGKLAFGQEAIRFHRRNPGDQNASRQTIQFEKQFGNRITFKTEQVRVAFQDQSRETQSTYSLSTALSKRFGLSASLMRADRPDEKKDESRRGFGFWWDLGKGMRVSYGLISHKVGGNQKLFESSLGLTPGEFQGVKLGALNYHDQSVDRHRNQSSSLLQLGTAKPIRLGPLRDANVQVGVDTQRSLNAWQRENRSFSLDGKLGTTLLGFHYRSQAGTGDDQAVDRAFSLQVDAKSSPKLYGGFFYKLRTLPRGQQVMIRHFQLTANLFPGLKIAHEMITNPEQARFEMPLLSHASPLSTTKWKLDYQGSDSIVGGLSWEEQKNNQSRSLTRVGGVHLRLLANKPSPVELFYGIEQNDLGARRQLLHRFSVRFDQRPGPNQYLSLYLSNLNWDYTRPEGQPKNSWQLRAEYQLKF